MFQEEILMGVLCALVVIYLLYICIYIIFVYIINTNKNFPEGYSYRSSLSLDIGSAQMAHNLRSMIFYACFFFLKIQHFSFRWMKEKIWVEICPQEDQVLFHTSKDLSQNVHFEIMSNFERILEKKSLVEPSSLIIGFLEIQTLNK